MSINKLAIGITFHFDETRFEYLSIMASKFHMLAIIVDVYILTNTHDRLQKNKIRDLVCQGKTINVEIHSPTYLGHPYLLSWCHMAVFKKIFLEDPSITHFMYLEDDICITPTNIEYWLQGRNELKGSGLIPSFLRYEHKKELPELYSTDSTKPSLFKDLPKININIDYCHINLPNPYQGMYLLDRELMFEHINGASACPEYSPWGIREKAAAGLTFANIPTGFTSRNALGYDLNTKTIDPKSLIHHTPNNYADNPNTPFGKIRLKDLIIF
jgi:hypothetical protein